MKKYVCTVCGYIAEGTIPEQCPVCKAPASAFVEKTGNTTGKRSSNPVKLVKKCDAEKEGVFFYTFGNFC